MKNLLNILGCRDVDGLRLLALSRIPRCETCPRLRALKTAHERGSSLETPLPAVPDGCDHEVCAPLVTRLGSLSVLVSH